MRKAVAVWLAFFALFAISVSLAAQEGTSSSVELVRIELFPQSFVLRGPRSGVQLLVTGTYADGRIRDVTSEATFESSDPAVVRIVEGRVYPQSDGQATIRAHVGQHQAECKLEVTDQGKAEPVSFMYGTLVALTKHGCNSGACHGSPSGKGGFRLSLRAFDPALDQVTLIREDFGRRINPLDPDNSLLLLKPLMKVPHGGGLRLTRHDTAYQLLRDWIAAGGQLDPPGHPECVRIEVFPPTGRVLRLPNATQQLAVWAHFSDGSVKDVTPLAVYSSSDEAIAEVDGNGRVTGHDRGEVAILVRYLDFMETCYLTFLKDIDGFTWHAPPPHNYIDELVDAKLQKLGYLPSELATDEEFLRRVYLDVVGRLPTVEEARAFLSDASPNKRARLIDDLLERPEFAKYWALKWGDILRLTVGQVGGEGVYKYHRWLERVFQENMPYDEFARQLLLASGSTLTNPPANFYRTAADETDCVEAVAQVFLGARLQCAKCHNHPFEKWTQDNYYGMAAFFNRVKKKPSPRQGELVIYLARAGEVVQPRTGRQMKPWVPVAGTVEVDRVDRRVAFLEWLTAPDNPFFARVEVNRIWSHLFGRGLVDPPDDFRESNPPAHGELLDALARDFVQHRFDRKHIIRTILNSRTYQTSFRPNEWNKDDTKYFSHYLPRMLSAEQLLDAICAVTGVPESFGPLPAGTLATHLPAPDLVKHEFLKIFGQPERQTVCACERTSESNLAMAIQFFNGPLIYSKLRAEGNRFRRLAASGKTDDEIVAELYLAGLSRMPTDGELQAAREHFARKKEELQQDRATKQQQIAQVRQTRSVLVQQVKDRLLEQKLQQVPEVLREDLKVALQQAENQRTEIQKYLVSKLGPLVNISDEEITAALTEEEKKKWEQLNQEEMKISQSVPADGAERLLALEDICWAILNTNEFLFQH
jgi:hypothetical protein